MSTEDTTTNDKRSIGPVTTAASVGAAVSFLICSLIQMIWGVEIATETQGALTVVLVALAGFSVPPNRTRGRRVAR